MGREELRSRLTTYEDYAEQLVTVIVETSSGKVFEVQKVTPGEILKAAGSPLMDLLTQEGLDFGKDGREEAEEKVRQLPDEKKIEIVSDPEFMGIAKSIVCSGVISVNFVDKPRSECDREKKEVPADVLNMRELMDLFTAIMSISVGEGEVQEFYTFREGSERAQDEYGQIAPDGEVVREEAVGTAVRESSEGEEPSPDAGTG